MSSMDGQVSLSPMGRNNEEKKVCINVLYYSFNRLGIRHAYMTTYYVM